ncbi:MAG: replication factor C small subunit, partial [Promethearchaeota archaeon]
QILEEITSEYGLSGINIIKNIHREIYDLETTEDNKIQISKFLAEYEYRLSQGATEEIQLKALLANIVTLKNGK